MTPSAAPATLLDWDSEFWGVRIARADPAAVRTDPGSLARWAARNDVRCQYLLCPEGDAALVAAAERLGFRHVAARVGYERSSEPAAEPAAVRPFRAADLEALVGIARSAHRDSRFYADAHFPRDRCDDLFATWMTQSCAGDLAAWVLVADEGAGPLGYITGTLDVDGAGRIGLVAVAEQARGRGLGASLLSAAMARFAADAVPRLRVTTQGANRGATRLYERMGFQPRERAHDFHWWRDDGGDVEESAG